MTSEIVRVNKDVVPNDAQRKLKAENTDSNDTVTQPLEMCLLYMSWEVVGGGSVVGFEIPVATIIRRRRKDH